MTDSIYSHFDAAKDETLIPFFNSGRTLESRYNPSRDAENLLSTIDKQFNFFLVLGIGSGIFLEKLSEKFPLAKIIAVENSESDLLFLQTNFPTKNILNKNNIILATIKNLNQKLIQNYIPAKYGDLKIIEQRNWIVENQSSISEIKKIIQDSLKIIAADFSVQSHFGKIWFSNILNNTKLLSTIHNYNFSFDRTKKALVVAAGPTLDIKLSEIKKDINKYFIISTDTAFSTLSKNNIKADIVISLDAQQVSQNHFYTNSKETVYAFDLCGNFSAVSHIADTGGKIFFFISGHPLSSLINNLTGKQLPLLQSGSGTVTIAALDLAVKLGFSEIKITGADFSYSLGKAYTKGTYLDNLYNLNSNLLTTSEKSYDHLLYRTDLIKIEDFKYTTCVLDSYKNSLINYFSENKLNFNFQNDFYNIISKNDEFISINKPVFKFNKLLQEIKSLSLSELESGLLPYISWLRKNQNFKDFTLEEFLKLAQSYIVSYN